MINREMQAGGGAPSGSVTAHGPRPDCQLLCSFQLGAFKHLEDPCFRKCVMASWVGGGAAAPKHDLVCRLTYWLVTSALSHRVPFHPPDELRGCPGSRLYLSFSPEERMLREGGEGTVAASSLTEGHCENRHRYLSLEEHGQQTDPEPGRAICPLRVLGC